MIIYLFLFYFWSIYRRQAFTNYFILNITIISYIEKDLYMERGVEAQIGYLLDNQLIKRISKNKLNINGKGRIYNQDKPPSKILTKVVDSL